MRVYILSDYGEYGAENVSATVDFAKLASMIKGRVPEDELSAALDKMEEALRSGDPIADSGVELQRGWGGLQLHIIELE